MAVFHHPMDGHHISQRPTYLTGFPDGLLASMLFLRGHAQHAVTRGTHQDGAVAALYQRGDIAGNGLSTQVVGHDIVKPLAVIGLQGAIHANVEQSCAVLHHAVDIVAGHAQVLTGLFFQNAKLIAVVTVQSVTCCNPDESVAVQENLRRKTARHLLVGIKQFTHLGVCAQGYQKKAEKKNFTYHYVQIELVSLLDFSAKVTNFSESTKLYAM